MEEVITGFDIGDQFRSIFDFDLDIVVVGSLSLDVGIMLRRRLGVSDGEANDLGIPDAQVSKANDAGI